MLVIRTNVNWCAIFSCEIIANAHDSDYTLSCICCNFIFDCLTVSIDVYLLETLQNPCVEVVFIFTTEGHHTYFREIIFTSNFLLLKPFQSITTCSILSKPIMAYFALLKFLPVYFFFLNSLMTLFVLSLLYHFFYCSTNSSS